MHEDHEISRRNFPTERRQVENSLLKLWPAFTGSRLATLVAKDNPTSKDSRESSADSLSGRNPAVDSDEDTLVSDESEPTAQTARPRTICYGDIDLFLLQNPVACILALNDELEEHSATSQCICESNDRPLCPLGTFEITDPHRQQGNSSPGGI
jgi:hypothetical protein